MEGVYILKINMYNAYGFAKPIVYLIITIFILYLFYIVSNNGSFNMNLLLRINKCKRVTQILQFVYTYKYKKLNLHVKHEVVY